MNHRQLGAQGPALSTIGFGCWAMGGAGWASSWGEQDDAVSMEAIQVAFDHGVTWFDTAAVYGLGHSEEVLGRALGARRADAVVATKCGLVWDEQGNITRNGHYESILHQCEASLTRLGTDYIDLYQMHWPDTGAKAPPEETMRAMETLVEQGKVRAVGVSNYSVPLLAASRAVRHVDGLQPPYSLFRRAVEADILPFCRAHGVGVVAYSPLASGLLGGRYTEETTFESGDWRSRDARFTGDGLRRSVATVRRLAALAAQFDRTVAQLAIAWVLANPAITAAIVGVRSPRHILDALPAADWQLDAATLDAIEAIMREDAGPTTA